MNSAKTLFEQLIREEYQHKKSLTHLNEDTKRPLDNNVVQLLKKWGAKDNGLYYSLRYKYLKGVKSVTPEELLGASSTTGGAVGDALLGRTNRSAGARYVSPTAGKSKWHTTYAPRLANALERELWFYKQTGEIFLPVAQKVLGYAYKGKRGNTTVLQLSAERGEDPIVDLYYWNRDSGYYKWNKFTNSWSETYTKIPKFQCIAFDSQTTEDDTPSMDQGGEPIPLTKEEQYQKFVNSHWTSYTPILGDLMDVSNAFIYIKNGRWAMSLLSLAGVLPLGHVVGQISRKYLAKFLVDGAQKSATPIPAIIDDIEPLLNWLQQNSDKLDPGIITTLHKNIDAMALTNKRILSKADVDTYRLVKQQLEYLNTKLKKASETLDNITSKTNVNLKTKPIEPSDISKNYKENLYSNLQQYFKVTGKNSLTGVEQDLLKMASVVTGITAPGFITKVAAFGINAPKYLYKGRFFIKTANESLERDLTKYLSNPNIWSKIGGPILGKEIKQSRKKAFDSWLDIADDNIPGVRDLKSARSRLSQLSPGTKPIEPNYAKSGFSNAEKLNLRNRYRTELADWERANDIYKNGTEAQNLRNSISEYTRQLRPTFRNSEIYRIHGADVVKQLVKTKIGEEYINKLSNRLVSYMNPLSRGDSAFSKLYGLGAETLANYANVKKHLDWLASEYVNVLTNAGKQPGTLIFNPDDARFAANYYVLYKTGTIINENDSYFVRVIKQAFMKLAQGKRDENEALKRVIPAREASATDFQ